MSKTVFITGATGFIGSHLAAKLIESGYKVFALVREKDMIHPRDRLLQAILKVNKSLQITHDNLIHILGDMTGETMGWITQIKDNYKGDIDEIWHLAAIFEIKKHKKEEVEDVNINGVKKIINFVNTINKDKKPRYFHVSTAYSSGRKHDTITEHIHNKESNYRSLYDWSKNCGEHIVHEYQMKHNIDVTILRPSIVVSSKGSKVVSHTAYYLIVKTLYSICKRVEASMGENFNGNIGVRFWCESDASLNIVPVDFVIDVMIRLSEVKELINNNLKIYNIVNESPPTIKLVRDILSETLNITGIDLVPKESFDKDPMTPLEKLFERGIIFQAPYAREYTHFSVENLRKVISYDTIRNPNTDEDFLRDINKNFIEVLEQNLLSNVNTK